jgi:hypothetical protein
MTTKTSLILAAFAAAIAVQPASANTATPSTSGMSAADTLALVRPSTAAVDKLKHLIEGARIDLAAMNAKPFPRVFVQEDGPSFVRAVKKAAFYRSF